jgi:hypothetical protein
MSLAMSSIVPLTILAFTLPLPYLVGAGCFGCLAGWRGHCVRIVLIVLAGMGCLRLGCRPAQAELACTSPACTSPQEPAALSAGFWGGAGLLMAGLALYNWQAWSKLLRRQQEKLA